MQNLWTDIDALARLAVTERGAERPPDSTRTGHTPLTPEAFPPYDRKEFEIHTIESPARIVTGDYSDTFLLSRDTLAIVMGDVSGKGTPAALLMGFVRSMVRNVSTFSDSPGDTLTRVNRMLYDANLGAMYTTIFLGWYDIRTGVLRYANAGHPRPYRVTSDGRVRIFGEVTGPILGILDVKEYADREARLDVGDRLMLYTDGVTEAHKPGNDEFLGTVCLEKILHEHHRLPLGRMCELVAHCVDDFQNNRRQDDATILGLQRNP